MCTCEPIRICTCGASHARKARARWNKRQLGGAARRSAPDAGSRQYARAQNPQPSCHSTSLPTPPQPCDITYACTCGARRSRRRRERLATRAAAHSFSGTHIAGRSVGVHTRAARWLFSQHQAPNPLPAATRRIRASSCAAVDSKAVASSSRRQLRTRRRRRGGHQLVGDRPSM